MGNPNLGEKEIILGGKKYILKMNFAALSETENRASVGSHALAQRLARGISGIQDITSIIYGGLVGKAGPDNDPPLSYEEVGELIFKDGQIVHLPLAKNLLTFGMTGKWEEEWEEEKNNSLKKKSKSPDSKGLDSIN